MATVRKVSGEEHRIRIECKGLSQEEFFDLYQEFWEQKLEPAIRNPNPLLWDLRTVHEIMITVKPYAIGVLGGAGTIMAKDAYAWIKKVITTHQEKTHKELAERTKIVPLYGSDGEVTVKVTRRLKKVKTK